jgi:hypothetical protein
VELGRSGQASDQQAASRNGLIAENARVIEGGKD